MGEGRGFQLCIGFKLDRFQVLRFGIVWFSARAPAVLNYGLIHRARQMHPRPL